MIKSSLQKYRYCKRFTFKCRSCKTENIVASAFKKNEAALQQCSNPECSVRPYENVTYIQNQLTLTLRECVSRFYENWLVCDEPSCNSNTRTYTHVWRRLFVLVENTFFNCDMNIVFRWLLIIAPYAVNAKLGFCWDNIRKANCTIKSHTFVTCSIWMHIQRLVSIFHLCIKCDLDSDMELCFTEIKVSPQIETSYKLLKDTIDQFLSQSAFCVIKLSKLFERLQPAPKVITSNWTFNWKKLKYFCKKKTFLALVGLNL